MICFAWRHGPSCAREKQRTHFGSQTRYLDIVWAIGAVSKLPHCCPPALQGKPSCLLKQDVPHLTDRYPIWIRLPLDTECGAPSARKKPEGVHEGVESDYS